MWEGPWFCYLKLSGYRDSLTRNKVGFPRSGLNAGSSFISQVEGMSESSVETLEKSLVPRLIWTGCLTSLFIYFFFLEKSLLLLASRVFEGKIWNASRICVSSLRRGHSNILCIVPILEYVLPKRAWTSHLLTPQETLGVQCFKGDEAWLFLKIDRNPKIFLETRNGSVVSHLSSRSVCIIVSSLV